jgi:hypothetical protein
MVLMLIQDWKSCARQAPHWGIGLEPNWNHSPEVTRRHLQLLQYRLERKELGEDVIIEAPGYSSKPVRTPGAWPDHFCRRTARENPRARS